MENRLMGRFLAKCEAIAVVTMVAPLEAMAGPLRETVAAAGEGHVVCAAGPAELPDLIDVFAAVQGDAFYWEQPAAEIGFLALGGVAAVQPQGGDRFATAAAWWHEIVAKAETPAGFEAAPFAAGGFAFAAEPEFVDPVWSGWPRNRWAAPRVVLERHPGGGRVQVQAPAGQPPAISLVRARAALSLSPRPCAEALAVLDLRDDPSHEWWDAAVAAVLAAVETGAVEKQVLARRVLARAAHPINQAGVLRRLRSRFPTATIFAARRAGRCFLGASPERLVALNGRTVSAVALAGTSRDAEGAAALLSDGKELREHAFVVEALRERLGPLCTTLECPEQPALMSLPGLAHLVTPLRGELAAPTSLLDLAAQVHPTPAVGSAPRQPDPSPVSEPFDRGWYAGPIGWARGDLDGEGDMAVALRSALLDGSQATLYAGCGIVRGSVAEREWREAGLKMEAVRAALSAAG